MESQSVRFQESVSAPADDPQRTDNPQRLAVGCCCCRIDWALFRQFLRQYQTIHQVLGTSGSLSFLAGSINALLQHSFESNVLFTVGSSLLLLGYIGETYVLYEERKIAESQTREAQRLNRTERGWKQVEDRWMELDRNERHIVPNHRDKDLLGTHRQHYCRPWATVRLLVKKYHLVQVTVGNVGSVLFVLGSLVLFDGLYAAGGLLFAIGFAFLLVGIVGQAMLSYEQKVLSTSQMDESRQWQARDTLQQQREAAWDRARGSASTPDNSDAITHQSEHLSHQSSSQSLKGDEESQPRLHPHDSVGNEDCRDEEYERPNVSRRGTMPDEVDKNHRISRAFEKHQVFYYAIQFVAYAIYITASFLFMYRSTATASAIMFIIATSMVLVGKLGTYVVTRQYRRKTEAEERSLQRRRDRLNERRNNWNSFFRVFLLPRLHRKHVSTDVPREAKFRKKARFLSDGRHH